MADLTFKAAGDAQLGRVYQPNPTDILPLLRDPYTGAGKDGYIQWQDLRPGVPVYNALTDGGIVADYVDRLNPGTDQRAAVVAWIQTNGLPAGKRHFHFPAGHYLFSEGVGNDSTVVDIQGYNDVIISGVPGETFFHTAQGLDLKYKNNPLFRIGWQQPAKRTIVRGITFVNDPYVTSSEESASDNGIQWGWKYYEPHRTSQAYEVGDIIVSSDDNWLITVTGAGTSASTEPTWSAGTTVDGSCTVSVVALSNWTASTAYTAGVHVKSTNPNNYHTAIGATTRSILWAANSGTSGSGATEPNVALPSNDGGSGAGSENSWDWVSAALNASDTKILDCEFSGMAGFSEAGGTALGMSGGGGGLVQNCYFHDAAYGGVTSGLFRNWTFRDCKHYKLGGWGYCWGTFNAHGYYVQGARNLWDNCTFDRHFYGLNIKVHANPANNDVWQNRIINCRFDNYGWGSVEWVGPIAATNDEVATDFVEEATSGSIHSAILSKQGEVINCTFRIYKSVYDAWDWRRPTATPNSGSGFAIKASTDGILVVGCDFTDTTGIYAGTTANWLGGSSPITVSACSFQTIFRKTLPFDGTIFVDNCVFDYRAVLGWSTGVQLRDWSRMSNCTIMGTTTATGSISDGALKIYGDFITVDNVTVSLTGVGQPFSPDSGNVHDNVRIANCKFIAPLGTLHLNPGSGKYWEFENNYWDISGWTSYRVTHNNHETWTWKNESGNLWTCRWDATQKVHNQGTVRIIPIPARSFNSQGGIVDESGIRVTDISNAYGVELINTDHAGGSPSLYKKFVAVSEDANQWILCSELVAKGDWLTLSASAGQLRPNGTSGSTTRPPSGIQARVIDAGTASAGAGRALVEVLEWNRVSTTGGGAVPYSGTSDPGASDDNTQGHVAGITGVNTSTGDMFICLDASTGAAVWQAI